MRLNFHDKETLQVIKDVVAAHTGRHYTIDELARTAGMSSSRLRAAFKKQFGFTIHQFSTTQKMQLAKVLIEEDKKSLAQVATATGFRHISNFITAFRKYYGHTPGKLKPQ